MLLLSLRKNVFISAQAHLFGSSRSTEPVEQKDQLLMFYPVEFTFVWFLNDIASRIVLPDVSKHYAVPSSCWNTDAVQCEAAISVWILAAIVLLLGFVYLCLNLKWKHPSTLSLLDLFLFVISQQKRYHYDFLRERHMSSSRQLVRTTSLKEGCNFTHTSVAIYVLE